MTTTFMKGDLFEDGADEGRAHAFAFPADVSGSLGQGISLAFAKRFPSFAEAFRAAKLQIGDVFAWSPGEGVWIYALGLRHGEKKPKIATLVRALDAMFARATEQNVSRIAVPRIGEGMDPLRVKKVLLEAGAKTQISLVVFDQFVRSASASSKAKTASGDEEL